MMNVERKKLSIRKNDQVQVITGREKGKVGKVVRVDLKSGRITVENVNRVKRHVKPTQQAPQGGILEKELPLHYSNVLLFCPKCNRGVRHGRKFMEKAGPKKGGKKSEAAKSSKGQVKIRVCKRCGESLELA